MALKTKLPPAIYVEDAPSFQAMIDAITGEDQIAVDTESNNMYVYYGEVCLIQLSTRKQDYIIDPLAIDDIQALGDIFADESVEKIFHAAEYDLICMKRDFGFEVKNLFDTMAASRLVGAQKFGLGDLLLNHFDVKVDKRHQRDNWGRRPLPKDSLIYAQMDTHYLHKLRDNLDNELSELERSEEAQEVFKDVLVFEIKDRAFDPDGFWKIGRPHRLNRREMAFLKEVFLLRERISEEVDRPPFKVLSNNVLINLAKKQPSQYQALYHIKGLGNDAIRRYGDEILEAIETGRASKTPKQPPREDIDPILSDRYIALHAWRKECAVKRNLDSSMILTKQTLWDLAAKMPQTQEDLAKIEGFGEWRMENYGASILKLIAKLK